MDSFEICRVCVEEVNHYWFLFERCNMIPSDCTPAAIITACVNVRIESDDGLPQLVCNSCLQALVSANQIREKCISSDRKLRKLLLQNKTSIVQRATIELPDQAVQTPNDTLSHASSMDEKEAFESPDEEDYDNYHTESDHIATSVPEVDLLESDSYDVEYLVNIKQQQNENDDDNAEDQPISVDNDDDKPISADDQTIDMEVQILKNEASEDSITGETAESYQNYIQTDASDDKKKFVCDICGKRFSTKGNLKAHILLHNNYKPFRCELCGDEFSRKHNYNVHKLRHTGKRVHQCPQCDKSFVCTVNLKHHMIIHSNVKPFKCSQCEKEFNHRTDLVRHEVKHTGIYPFSCELCQHKFCRKTNLTKHLLKCKGEKKIRPFKEDTGELENSE
ncbi:zinc finger protein 616-like [Anopheles funestus]|uniref:zinc finger protein 616-like n=1 Tax=Anopheles funestus TaxID=62324 RepID=UPI0020C5D24D|nr:zinc finger protein 616-like [Anopheles funestus]